MRLGNAGKQAILSRLEAVALRFALEHWTGKLVMVTPTKVRVYRDADASEQERGG
jgi:hypothetical protein